MGTWDFIYDSSLPIGLYPLPFILQIYKVYEEPVPWPKKIPYCAAKLLYESLYCSQYKAINQNAT